MKTEFVQTFGESNPDLEETERERFEYLVAKRLDQGKLEKDHKFRSRWFGDDGETVKYEYEFRVLEL